MLCHQWLLLYSTSRFSVVPYPVNVTPLITKGDEHQTEKLSTGIAHMGVLEAYGAHTLYVITCTSKHSCESQLILTANDILHRYYNFEQVVLVILYFSKAFDMVSHKVFLSKLLYIGLDGKTLDWISAFLVNRTQCVVVNGSFSSPSTVHSSVPQGTVLRPLLFLCYINDISDCVGNHKRKCNQVTPHLKTGLIN